MAANTASRTTMASVGVGCVRTFHLDFEDLLPGGKLGEMEYAITDQQWLGRRPRITSAGGAVILRRGG